MQPTIGRIVHFHDEGGPYAAIVTAVRTAGESASGFSAPVVVDLATFGSRSLYFHRDVREHEGSLPAIPGTWTWPPRVGVSP